MCRLQHKAACAGVIELSRHLTTTVSHKAVKFLTKPFVLQTSKKLITTQHEKVAVFFFFALVAALNSTFTVAQTACNSF